MKYFTLILIAFCLQSCIYGRDDEVVYESAYEITQSREIFENNIEVEEVRPISNAGKIYVKDQYILINENQAGFHLFHNFNP